MYIFQILNIFLNSRFSAHLWRTDAGAGPNHGMEKLFPGKQNYGKDLEPWLIITFKWASGSMTQLSKLFLSFLKVQSGNNVQVLYCACIWHCWTTTGTQHLVLVPTGHESKWKKIIEVSWEQARGRQTGKHNSKSLKEFNVYSLSKGGLKGTWSHSLGYMWEKAGWG